VQPLVDRAMRLTPILQRLFREWDELDQREWLGAFSPPTAFPQLPQRHLDLHSGMDDERLRKQLAENLELYEALAVTMFAKALESVPGVELDPTAQINPYAISLDPQALGTGWPVRRQRLLARTGGRAAASSQLLDGAAGSQALPAPAQGPAAAHA
jgi:hypothetical protein